MELVIAGLPRTLAQPEEEQTTTEEHEEENPLIPEPDELIFGSIAFLVVFVVLARVAFPRLNEAMKARTSKIQGDLEKAERARNEAESALSRYEEQLREARSESGRIIDETRKTAESMRRDLLAKAEDESRQVVERAQEEIRAERDRAFQELRRQVGEISVELAARVVGESLDRDRQLRLVEGYIDEVAGMGGNGHGRERQQDQEGRPEGGTEPGGP
jgi:F-type H+-transporting ATPase subunit b